MSDDAPDVAALLAVLDEAGVAYVVTGSVAVMAHGVGGAVPGDLDIVPATDPANLRRLAAALVRLGAEARIETGEWRTDEDGEHLWVEDGIERPPRALDPADPETFDHSFATRLGRLDVVPRVAGDYAELRPPADRLPVDGVPAWVAAPRDLLRTLTVPRRAKDAGRVRGLRDIAPSAAAGPSGVGFIGLRTDRFAEMVAMFRDLIGLEPIREAPGATWFRLGADAELHVYAGDDPDHAFFTTGPVVGLRVADVEATRRRLAERGLEMLTDVERTGRAAWCHFRAPDGTVMEIIS